MSDDQTRDAPASPAKPVINPVTGQPQPPMPGGMRSIYERMTNPTPDDLKAADRARFLTRAELDLIINRTFGGTLEYLASVRDDIKVTRKSTPTTWTIHVEMRGDNVPDPTFGIAD